MNNGRTGQVPVSGGPAKGADVVPPKKSRVGLIIGLVAGGVALIGVATAVILLVILGNRPDYEGARDIVAQMIDNRTITEGGFEVEEIMDGSADEETIAEAEATVEGIREAVTKLKNLTKELGESSALKDEAVKKRYDEFMATSDEVLPKLDKLASTVEVLIEFAQEFAKNDLSTIISGDDIEGAQAMTEEKIREIFAPLKTVGLSELTKFAEDSEEIYVKLLNFFKEYGSALSGGSLSASQAAEAMEVYNELATMAAEYKEEWMGEDALDMGERLLGITQREISEYYDRLDYLRVEIEDKM